MPIFTNEQLKQVFQLQIVDFEIDVCKISTTSLHFVPLKKVVTPWAENMCRYHGKEASFVLNNVDYRVHCPNFDNK